MTVHEFKSELWLPAERESVFEFFSDAQNLEMITPPWLNFKILTPAPIAMRAGAKINYRLRVHGVPISWLTHISSWEPPYRFVDEQLRGPYRKWIHEHTFESEDGGTLCRDFVRYAVPGGRIVNAPFIRHEVRAIFDYRGKVLAKIFSSENRGRMKTQSKVPMIGSLEKANFQ
jgi:ligand-binding SRPBCC domain-containing protein